MILLIVVAAWLGATEAVPVSRTGHDAALRLFLDAKSLGALEAAIPLAIAAAMIVAARKRIARALADGVRAVARPALFRESGAAEDAALFAIGGGASAVVAWIATPAVDAWSDAPLASGLGLVATGIALLSTLVAPRAHRDAPSRGGALAIGIAVGLASFPGASMGGAALTLLLWLGVRPARALDFAFVVAAPAALVGFARSHAAGDLGGFEVASCALAAFFAALSAASLTRRLLERRRLFVLGLWTIPLGLALLAYARAIDPDPRTRESARAEELVVRSDVAWLTESTR